MDLHAAKQRFGEADGLFRQGGHEDALTVQPGEKNTLRKIMALAAIVALPLLLWAVFRSQSAHAIAPPNDTGDITVMLPGDVPLVMVRIPAGAFMMGRYPGEEGSSGEEDPQHRVMVPELWMSKYVTTKVQWEAVMNTTPWSGGKHVLDDPDSPAVYVSWDDAHAFITVLNAHITDTGQGPATMRLPSEAEWEYACRAGTTTRFHWGDRYDASCDHAWSGVNAGRANAPFAHRVGVKLPNAFGLYDMSGNVWEWCEDDDHSNYEGAPSDGSAWVDSPRGGARIARGGSWETPPSWLRSARRARFSPDARGVGSRASIGFRLARSVSPSTETTDETLANDSVGAAPPDSADPTEQRTGDVLEANGSGTCREDVTILLAGDVLHEDRAPAQVYAALLDETRYLCSARTMCRFHVSPELRTAIFVKGSH